MPSQTRSVMATMAALAVNAVMAQSDLSFTMFPAVNASSLATNLGWSLDCLVAMNATLACDPDLYRMAGQVDNYYWSLDNLTSLCTSSCLDDSSTWVGNVGDACGGQTFSVAGKLVPVDTVALRYVEGVTMACLMSDNLPMEFTGNATLAELSLTDSDINNPDSTNQLNDTTLVPLYDPNEVAPSTPDGIDDPYGPDNITDLSTLQGPTWCMLEAQDWIGADVDVDCDEDPDAEFCSDPDAMDRMANLYYSTTLCNTCFITVLWYRINSLFLPDTDYSDYLIEQYQDILDICQVAMPDSMVRVLPGYAAAPNITYLPPGTDPADTNGTTPAPGVCIGQTLSPSTSGCDSLSDEYGVTTGDLQSATGSDDCTITASICVPKPCTLKQVADNATCAGLAAEYTTASLNVSLSLFLAWNPNIMGLCDNLTESQYVCSTPPGGAYTLLPPINGTNADASGQDRGGQGPGGIVPTVNSTAAAPTQPGISPNCTKFAYAAVNNTCYDFTQAFSISMADLTTWNPVLGYPDGHNCTTQFWTGYDYCVEINGGTTTTTTTSTTHKSTSTLPYPTQSGIISTCNKYKNAASGDYCSEFAAANNITTQQLYAWNAILGPNGENCATQFQANVDYCVGVSGTTTPTKTTTTLPYLTQSGIISTCNKYKNAASGDYCSEFAAANNITTQQLYAWNAILGPNGENCGTQFQANVDYCVGVSGGGTTTTAKTTSSKIPTQSGIVANCKKIVAAKAGDYCYLFAQENNITTTQLYQWNPILGANGANCSLEFQTGEGYCVSA